MPIASDNVYERARASFLNILSGDPVAAARGAFAPQRLSPVEKRETSERLFGDDPGQMAGILDVATNPIVVMGAILTWRYKIPTVQNLLGVKNKILSYAKRSWGMADQISDLRGIFPNTPIPYLFEEVARTSHIAREKYLGLINQGLTRYEASSGRKFTRETGIRIAASVDGLDDPANPTWGMARAVLGRGSKVLPRVPVARIRLDTHEQALAGTFREVTEGLYAQTVAPGANKAEILKMAKSLGWGDADDIAHLRQYFPHFETLDVERFRAMQQRWLADAVAMGKGARAAVAGERPAKILAGATRKRRVRMLPDEKHLEAAGLMSPELRRAYSEMDTVIASRGDQARVLRRYGLDLGTATEKYVGTMSQTLAWSTPPVGYTGVTMGGRIMEELNILKSLPGARGIVKANMLKDTYIPAATGQLTMEQWIASSKFSDLKHRAIDILDRTPGIPEGTRTFLKKPFLESHNLSFQQVGHKIQNWIYNSTLGFNFLSPMRNMLQTLLTTAPTIGTKWTAKGIEETLRRSSKYRGLVKQHGPRGALKRAFPEFHELGLDVGGINEAMKFSSLIEEEATRFGVRSKLGKAYRKFQDTGLWMFSTSERFNRMSAFYGARAKAISELPGARWIDPFTEVETVLKRGSNELGRAATLMGAQAAHLTQFGGGPLNTPYAMIKRWPPWRQFTQFPLRIAHYLMGPAWENKGMLGRTMLGSGLAYEAGQRIFNTDISQSLIFGATPQPGTEHAPLGVAPLVAPFPQILASGFSALVRGDMEDITGVLPLMVPGGLAAARLATAAFPGGAKALGRPYADYEGRGPDGRIPVYSSRGALAGRYTPTQLFAKSIGLGDISSAKERELMGYLLSQRDRIREFRRRYVEAVAHNNMDKARSIQAEYGKAYPGMGGLQLKKSDLEAIYLRREVTRIERLIQTMPPETREAFAGVVSASLGARAPGFLGTDPGLFGTTTARQRYPGRTVGPELPGLPSPFRPKAAQSARQVGRQRRDEMQPRGFAALKAFTPP